MKIIKKPKFKKIECYRCGCIFTPSDVDIDQLTAVENVLSTNCPVCRAPCAVEPKKKVGTKVKGVATRYDE